MSLTKEVAKIVEEEMKGGESGHDWLHVKRVLANAQLINKKRTG